MVAVNGVIPSAFQDQSGPGDRLIVPDFVFSGMPPQAKVVTQGFIPSISTVFGGAVNAEGQFAQAPDPATQQLGFVEGTVQDEFFEKVHILPRSIELGTILTPQVVTIDMYNANRILSRQWLTFVNGAGAGITFVGIPALPTTLQKLQGLTFTMNVSPDGPPSIDGSLDFTFESGTDPEFFELPVTGERTVVFPFEPEIPMQERLGFRTDVITHRDGTEQRASLRNTPRQKFELTLAVEGFDRQVLEATVFDAQPRAFGLPMWHEARILKQDIAVDDLTITVNTTDFADFRVGGLAVILDSVGKFEALEIDSLTSTTITFATPFTETFSAGIRVLPLRIALMTSIARGQRHPRNLQIMRTTFRVVDNVVDIADTSAFSSIFGKVLFDDANKIEGLLSESLVQTLIVIDNKTGTLQQFSDVPVSRRTQTKGFAPKTPEQLFQLRQLFHALKGRATSFFIPTFFNEFEVLNPILALGLTLDISNIGYTKFVQSRQPRNVIRLTKTDGTVVVRTVVGAAEIDSETEQLTIDSAWGVGATLDEIERIDYLEKARFNSDDIQITHLEGSGTAKSTVPVITVLE